MRMGLFVGFLIGAGLAVLFSKIETAEAPGELENGPTEAEGGPAPLSRLLRQLRGQAREAMAAARKEADEKEEEMRRDFQRATHRR